MAKVQSKKDIDILEQRGLWEASSFLHRRIKKLIGKKQSLRIGDLKTAHKIMFDVSGQADIAGKYRRHNGPELRRIDGTPLPITDWRQIPAVMSELDFVLREETRNLKLPKNERDYRKVIFLAVRLSHRLACIHPFVNGNGRASRLLLNAILIRAGLPEISIKKSKPAYLKAMRQTDDGNFDLLENIVTDGLLEAKKKHIEIIARKKSELLKSRKKKKKRRLHRR